MSKQAGNGAQIRATGQRFGHRWLASMTVATLVAVGIVPVAQVAAVSASVAQLPIPDPAAVATRTLQPCAGQNVAAFTASDFQAVLGLNRPVAERAAEVASDLRAVDHLLAVEGIGPGVLASIRTGHPGLCATPPQVPPSPKDLCVSRAQFDLNNLGDSTKRNALDKATILSQREVETINRLGPFASVRVALAVLGIGDGGYKQLMAGSPPLLCVTPPGFITASGTTYAWVSAFLNDQVAADGFALTVAAGTINDPAGAWAYINREDIDLGHGTTPVARADVHLLNNEWSASGKKVWVTVPADRSATVPGIRLEQTVWHETGSGQTQWLRAENILDTGNSLTIEATSTSWFTSVVGVAWEGFRWLRGRSVGSPTCGGATPPAGSFHVGELLSNSPGGLIGECTYGNGDAGQGGAVGATDRIRAEFSATYSPISGIQISNPGAGNDIVSSIVAGLWPGLVGSFGADTNAYVPPAVPYWTGSTYNVPAAVGHYRIEPNLAATGLGVVGDQTFGLVLNPLHDYVKTKLVALGIPADAVDRVTDNAVETLVGCGYSMFHTDFPTTASEISQVTYEFFQTCLPQTFRWIVNALADDFEDYIESGLQVALNTLLRINLNFDFIDDVIEDVVGNKLYETAAQIASTLVDILRAFVVSRDVYLGAPAVRPNNLDTGHTIPASCIQSDGNGGYRIERSCVIPALPPTGSTTYIVRVNNDPLAFVVRGGVNVGEFASGGDYICAAQSLLVKFVKDRTFTEVFGTSSARLTCPRDIGGAARNISAVDNVLLRMSDGTTYFKNSSTLVGIEHVLDGGCFERLALTHFGYDYVTRAEVESALKNGWEIDDASAACGT